jgi:hypothetical protein
MTAVLASVACSTLLAVAPAAVEEPGAATAAEAEWSPIPDDLGTAEPARPPERADGGEERGDGAPSAATEAPAGRWVHTVEYGSVWMPYSSAYAYAPPGGSISYAYVYGPAFGWSWVIASPAWHWWAPGPRFGFHAGFGWRSPGWWYGHRHPRWYGPGHGPRVWRGTSPAPFRGGVGGRGVPRGGFGGARARPR